MPVAFTRPRLPATWDLQALHATWGVAIYRYLVVVLASRSLADDLLGEVFEQLLARRQQVAAAAEPQAYALRLAANAARDLLRREARRRRREVADDALVLCASPEPEPLPGEAVAAINTAIAALPLEQREVVVLKVWDERTFAEIGDILAISPNTAASRYRYALIKLRSDLRGLADV